MKNKAPDEIAREHKVGTRKFANLLWESKTNNFTIAKNPGYAKVAEMYSGHKMSRAEATAYINSLFRKWKNGDAYLSEVISKAIEARRFAQRSQMWAVNPKKATKQKKEDPKARARKKAERIARKKLSDEQIKNGFYKSREWKAARYAAFELHGNKCQCCGASPQTGAVLHVDHIKPRSLYPEHALNAENLQILCEDCNIGKSNLWETDWR